MIRVLVVGAGEMGVTAAPDDEDVALQYMLTDHAAMQQMLVTVWVDGSASVAYRAEPSSAWSPGYPLERVTPDG